MQKSLSSLMTLVYVFHWLLYVERDGNTLGHDTSSISELRIYLLCVIQAIQCA